MRKAIIVTNVNQQYNAKHLGRFGVGETVIFTPSTFPRSWKHVVLDQEGEIDRSQSWVKEGFRSQTDHHTEAGFYPVAEPDLQDNEYIDPSAIYFDAQAEVFTYPVETYTQEELDAQAEQAQQDQDDLKEDENKDGGLKEWRVAQRLIRNQVRNGTITEDEAAEIKARLLEQISPIFSGDWDAANWRLQQIDFSTIIAGNKVKAGLNQLKTKFINYYNNNYQRPAGK